ncbi:GGDEF domain-containing protein [Paenibacillus phocaensis]|uniref:GGDEF domain-containing protein n=1 Tax=Paenibacillus phocaensis TaxID=1776378 RepID=UPI000ABCF840|nr:diguanylate cyclase [Paenibacillus phocaensis]
MEISKRLAAGFVRLARGSAGLNSAPRSRKDNLRELLEQQSRILDMIAMGIQLKRILQELAGFIERQTDASCAIFLPDTENGAHPLGLVAASGLPREYVRRIQGLEMAPMLGACAAAAYEQRLIVVPDVGDDPRCAYYRDLLLDHPQLSSCWAVPILAPEGGVAAVIELHREQHAPPSADTLAFLDMAGRLIWLAAWRLEMRDELHRRLYHDEVTGLPNRSFFRERLEQSMRQEEGGQRPFAVLYIEIAGLQAVYERLGQVAEDDWQKQIADVLYSRLPAAAVLCRMGECRFAAIAWDLTEAEAVLLGRGLAAAIGEISYPLAPECRLTAAVGIGVFPLHGEGVFQAARANLYLTKDSKDRMGR